MMWNLEIHFHSGKLNAKMELSYHGFNEFWFAAHVSGLPYVQCKHANPTNIHTETTWSLLNNCEETSKVILLYWNIIFSLLFFVRLNCLHVRSNLFPGLTYERFIEKNICRLVINSDDGNYNKRWFTFYKYEKYRLKTARTRLLHLRVSDLLMIRVSWGWRQLLDEVSSL